MSTKTNKQEKRDALLLASFYGATAVAVILFNLLTYLLEKL